MTTRMIQMNQEDIIILITALTRYIEARRAYIVNDENIPVLDILHLMVKLTNILDNPRDSDPLWKLLVIGEEE